MSNDLQTARFHTEFVDNIQGSAAQMNEVKSGPRIIDAVFTLEDVSVSYGKYVAVTDVNLQIPSNDITAFIGPSGCGKSTLIRTLNRTNDLIPGASVAGKVMYHDADLYDSKASAVEIRRRIGMVFQKPNPFPKSIYENVAFGPKVNGRPKKSELDAIVEKS